MKNSIFLVMVCTLAPSSVYAAPRNQSIQPQCSACTITRAIVPTTELQKPLTERERDHLIFTNCVSLLTNFVKLFLDPHNIPEAKQNANNILNGINNLAHVITRGHLTKDMQEELFNHIAQYCQDNIKLEEIDYNDNRAQRLIRRYLTAEMQEELFTYIINYCQENAWPEELV